jgi:pimeloyl-ACP methyl ester carboxylesterase
MHKTAIRRAHTKTASAVIWVFILILAAFSLPACRSKSSGSEPPVQQPRPAAGDLVNWSAAGSLDAVLLNEALLLSGITGVSVNSGTTCYKLNYKTPDISGTLIDASGLVCLPAGRSGGSPVFSYQHGTIFQDSEAPSSFSLANGEALFGALLGGLGFIAVLPDYVGYGDSTAVMHPYLHAGTLASATVDMNRAARKFIALPEINRASNGQLFLAGYSEGGYATLATQRLMEQSLASEFPLTAAESGAGPYDLTGTARTFLGSATQPEPAFVGFFLTAYDSIYNQPSRLSVYFAPPYADIVTTHFDGTFSRSEINTALGGVDVATSSLFNADFLTSFLDTGEQELKTHIAENDIYHWAPGIPTRLFHGVNDDIVPYANTTTAKAAMDALGSTTVTVVTCDAGAGVTTTHNNCIKPFGIDVIYYFQTLATGL